MDKGISEGNDTKRAVKGMRERCVAVYSPGELASRYAPAEDPLAWTSKRRATRNWNPCCRPARGWWCCSRLRSGHILCRLHFGWWCAVVRLGNAPGRLTCRLIGLVQQLVCASDCTGQAGSSSITCPSIIFWCFWNSGDKVPQGLGSMHDKETNTVRDSLANLVFSSRHGGGGARKSRLDSGLTCQKARLDRSTLRPARLSKANGTFSTHSACAQSRPRSDDHYCDHRA